MPKIDPATIVQHPEDDEFDEPNTSFTELVGHRVRELRKAQGLSTEAFVAKCHALGLPGVNFNMVNNIEVGRKACVSIDEIVWLAIGLDVAPVHLVIPVNPGRVCFLGQRGYTPELLREWFRGLTALDVVDSKRFHTNVPNEEWDEFRERASVPGRAVYRPLDAGEYGEQTIEAPEKV